MKALRLLPRQAAELVLRLYQKILSFDHGFLKFLYPHGYCRFHPTCSEYAIAAISRYGVMRGGMMALWRVLRCNPWNRGGWDPVK